MGEGGATILLCKSRYFTLDLAERKTAEIWGGELEIYKRIWKFGKKSEIWKKKKIGILGKIWKFGGKKLGNLEILMIWKKLDFWKKNNWKFGK